MKLHYYNSAGKPTTRDLSLVALEAGSHVQVEAGTTSLKITKSNGKYVCGCEKHNAKCEMDRPKTALEWAETHLKQFHS